MAVMAAAGLASCQADMDVPALVEPKATMEANTTISDLKTAFADKSVLCPMKDEESQIPYIIHGRVVSSDASGNIYKSIVIQDETAAIALSVNQGSTYTDYRLGQEIVLNVTGLYVGYYRGLQQIGWLGEPYDGQTQLNFMAWDLFLGHSEMNGFPNPDVKYVSQDDAWPASDPYCIVTQFSKLPASGEAFRNMQSQLVEFRNVYFEEGGKETYAPYQESVNRTLKDASGGSLVVRTSGYSNFYNEIIPEGTGTVRGILSYYGDSWQLLLRGLGDVMITQKGQKDDPYTVAEAIELGDQGVSGWVTAYIVGSVKAGVQTVTSDADVIFGSEAELPNNILIAGSASETDWQKCMVVSLPQGSDFRNAVNLLDNPGVIGKAILLNGVFGTLYGMPAIVDNGGTAADVEVEGVVIGGGQTPGGDAIPAGTGSKESPYNPDQVKSASPATDVWMEGYVAGYAPTAKWAEAVFGSTPTEGSTNYTNGTNVILSMVAPPSADASNSVPVGLMNTGDVRATLGISKNPAIYGARVKVKGEITSYFGMTSMKNVSEYVIVEGGSGETPTPGGDAVTVFEGLTKGADGWSFDNVTVPSEATNGIWQWDSRYETNQYLKASAFISSVAYESLSYAVSPEIDLTGCKSAVVTFDHAARFQTTLRQLCGFAVRQSGSQTWTELAIPQWPVGGDTEKWNFVNSGDIDLSAYIGKKIQIAFKYGSSTAGADTWEVKNVKISATK